MERLERKIIYGVLIGVAVYAAVALYADFGALKEALAGFAWWAFAAALGLSTANYVLRFVKWEIFLRVLGIRVPLGRSALIFTAGFVMSVTPGKMGEVLKSVLLRQSDGVPVAQTAPVVFAERLTDFIALIVLAATGVGTYQYGVKALVVASLLVVVGIGVVSIPAVAEFVLGLSGRVPVVGPKVEPKLREAYFSARLLLRPAPLLGTSLLSVVSWGLECVAFWLVVQGFKGADPTIAMELAGGTFVFAITTILGAVSFMPGGLGVAEVSMIGALKYLGMVQSDAVAGAASVLTRLATLWWAVLWGFVAFVIFQRVRPNHEGASEDTESSEAPSAEGAG